MLGGLQVGKMGKSNSFSNLASQINVETLSDNKTLVATDKTVQWLDPGGASRDVILQAEASSTNRMHWIYNSADGAGENLVVKNDGGTTIATLEQGMTGFFGCDGTDWKQMQDGERSDAITKNGGATLTAFECRGQVVYVTATGTIVLPAVSVCDEGACVTIYSTTAATVHVDPNAADRIILDGVALDDGDKITSAGNAGNLVTLHKDSAAGWTTIGRSGLWIDGG